MEKHNVGDVLIYLGYVDGYHKKMFEVTEVFSRAHGIYYGTECVEDGKEIFDELLESSVFHSLFKSISVIRKERIKKIF
jgi:hypothetical protein